MTIRATDKPDWPLWRRFWSWQPAWQNSVGSITRLAGDVTFLVAEAREGCVGYAAIALRGGRLMQLAVAPDHRRQGIGRKLLDGLRDGVPADRPLSIINVDGSATASLRLLRSYGFVPTVGQFEMVRPI